MASYDVVGPDGQVLTTVEGPEGLSDAEIWDRGQRQILSARASPTMAGSMQKALAERSGVGRFFAGVGAPLHETYYGIKELFTDLSPADRAQLEAAQGIGGGAATAGRVAGEVGQFALPAAGGARAATALVGRGLPRAMAARGVTPATRVAGEAAAISGLAAAGTPGGLEERARAAGTEAMGAGIGGAVGEVGSYALPKAIAAASQGAQRVLKPSPEARELAAAGVPLTPGQFSSRPTIRAAEAVTERLPIIGGRVTRARDRANLVWNQEALRAPLRGAPYTQGGAEVTTYGPEGFLQLRNAIGSGFDQFWLRRITDEGQRAGVGLGLLLTENLKKKVFDTLGEVDADRVWKNLRTEVSDIRRTLENPDLSDLEKARSLQQYSRNLHDDMYQARDAGLRREANIYQDAIGGLERFAGEGFTGELRKLNQAYSGLKTLERAAGYKTGVEGGSFLTQSSLAQAVSAENPNQMLAQGRAPLQREVDVAQVLRPERVTVGESVAIPAAATAGAVYDPVAAAALGVAGAPLTSEAMRRFLTGTPTPPQAEMIRRMMRVYGAPVGAAYPEQETNP